MCGRVTAEQVLESMLFLSKNSCFQRAVVNKMFPDHIAVAYKSRSHCCRLYIQNTVFLRDIFFFNPHVSAQFIVLKSMLSSTCSAVTLPHTLSHHRCHRACTSTMVMSIALHTTSAFTCLVLRRTAVKARRLKALEPALEPEWLH